MIEKIYLDILLSAWTLLLFFGLYSLFGKMPRTQLYENYRRSRHLVGAGFLVFSAQIFIQWLFHFRSNVPYVSAALLLTCFYIEAILFGMSFISLLDKSYISRKSTYGSIAKFILFAMVMWGSALLLEGTARKVLMYVAAAFFFMDAATIALRFFSTYHKAVTKMENYYSDDVDAFVKWLSQSTHGIVFFGLIASVLAFAPQWVIAIYTLAGIFMFAFIFSCFIDYAVNYELVNTATEAVSDNSPQNLIPESNDTRSLIDSRLRKWIADRGYIQPGITIEQLATDIGTNRTYLSSNINTEYGCSFHEWIIGLRIEEAKKMMRSNHDISIVQVAEDVGFASAAHFSRSFSRREGKAPSCWRKNLTK